MISTTISAVAAAQSAVALQQAHEASVTACHALMPSFQGGTATIETARAYSECVQLIYPADISGGEVMAAKALIVLMLVGIVIGLYIGFKESWNRMEDMLFYAFFGGIFLPFGAVICCGIYLAIGSLFK